MTSLIRLYATRTAVVLESEGRFVRAPAGFTLDFLFKSADPAGAASAAVANGMVVERPAADTLSAPIGQQEIWAAGVTYLRSKAARMEESKDVGGGTFYDRVYDADRPELFFKSTP